MKVKRIDAFSKITMSFINFSTENYTKYELILTVNDRYFKKESEKSLMECSILAENRMITWQISL